MFGYLMGEFDMKAMLNHSPTFVLFIFPCFQIFFLIFLAQTLAALVFRWRYSRRDAEEFSLGGALGVVKKCMALALTTQTQQWKGEDDNTGKIDMSRMEGRKGEGAEDGADEADHEEQQGDA